MKYYIADNNKITNSIFESKTYYHYDQKIILSDMPKGYIYKQISNKYHGFAIEITKLETNL